MKSLRWSFTVGLFQPGILFGPYCIIYGFERCFLLFTLTGLKKSGFMPENSRYAVSRVPRNCRRDYSDGIDRQLSHGMADRRLDVGLPEILLRFSGQNRAEPESSFRRGGMIILIFFQPFFERLTALDSCASAQSSELGRRRF